MAPHLEELDQHIQYLTLAIAEAEKCVPTTTAFSVGCVLVVRLPDGTPPVTLATGYSRELAGNTHAEANALSKARSLSAQELSFLFPHLESISLNDVFTWTDVYTTLEPCSVRTSGLAPCADDIIASKLRRCFIGVGEPADFVNCEGAQKLEHAGIEVIWLNGLEIQCLDVARRGHEKKG